MTLPDQGADEGNKAAPAADGSEAGDREWAGSLQAGDALDRLGLKELKKLLAVVRHEYEPLLSERNVVCIAGPVNSGKSSLYNALVGTGSPRALVSPVPGSTRRPLRGDAEGFWVVDTPGANEMAVGEEGPQAGAERHDAAIAAAGDADFLLMLFDAARGIAQDEVRIFSTLAGLGKPYIVALNKIDLIGRDKGAVLQAAAHNLGLPEEEIVPISALRRTNLDRLLLAVVKADPRLAAVLARHVPSSRWLLAQNTILGASAAAGTANLMTAPFQIPFASFVPISAVQVAMVLRLARIFGYKLGPARAKEILLSLGSGLLGRTLFYQLVDLVPIGGYVLGTAIAAGMTMAIGYSTSAWFAYGERPTSEKVRQLSERMTRDLVRNLGKVKDRRSLRESIRLATAEVLGHISGEVGAPAEESDGGAEGE